MSDAGLVKGDRLVAYGDRRPCERLFIEVTRMARDRSWADIKVCTWAVMWTKRQKLNDQGLPPESNYYGWDQDDLDAQEADHMWMLQQRTFVQ